LYHHSALFRFLQVLLLLAVPHFIYATINR
jgi:hypothetical protein